LYQPTHPHREYNRLVLEAGPPLTRKTAVIAYKNQGKPFQPCLRLGTTAFGDKKHPNRAFYLTEKRDREKGRRGKKDLRGSKKKSHKKVS